MRDDQVRRYARHILLPDVGGLGQTALLTSRARIELAESAPDAELLAARYLVAGGVGAFVLRGASEDQIAALRAQGPDTEICTDGDATADQVALRPTPAWWPTSAGDHTALAYWRGGLAATRWMARIANR